MSLGAGRDNDHRALIEAAQRGVASAAKELSDRLSPVIHARVRRVLARRGGAANGVGAARSDAHDLAGEIWLSLFDRGWKKLRAYDPQRGATLEGYVGVLAEHEAINRLESEGAQKRGGRERHVQQEAARELPSRDPTPEELAVTRDLAAGLHRHVMESLPERGRLIFRYLYTDGRSPDETAAILGVEKQVVYNWQHKIRELARGFLEVRTS